MLSFTRNKQTIWLAILGLLLLTSCYKETIISEKLPESSLNFTMSAEQEVSIYEAYNEKLDINPEPILWYGENEFEVDDFELRGESALRYRKKSFNVRTDIPITFTNNNIIPNTVALRNFKLISLVSDYTYIENRIAFDFLKNINLQPLFFVFKEVELNGNTQGLYLLFESPAEYLIKQNHECLIRRGRNGAIADIWFYANFSGKNENDYKEAFNNIYNIITQYQGQQLYDSLALSMNISNYFRRTAIDLLLQNGDTSDEIYFIATNSNNKIYFDVIPWDCDDMFAKLPHEIGRSFAMGTRFGERNYNSMDDVIADVGDKLVYTIEDDFDYIIAKDTFLYKKYLTELDFVLNTINESTISNTCGIIRSELTPYLKDEDIIEQTTHCSQAFTYNDFDQNILNKEQYIIERRQSLISKLNEHKQMYHAQ